MSIKHYEQVIERARRNNPSNRYTIIAECRWHIEQIEAEAEKFNAAWARLRKMKREALA